MPVYALSLLPQEICLKPDRTTTYSTTAYYADAHDTVSQGFNREPFGGDAFLYEGKLYFTAGEGLIIAPTRFQMVTEAAFFSMARIASSRQRTD